MGHFGKMTNRVIVRLKSTLIQLNLIKSNSIRWITARECQVLNHLESDAPRNAEFKGVLSSWEM